MYSLNLIFVIKLSKQYLKDSDMTISPYFCVVQICISARFCVPLINIEQGLFDLLTWTVVHYIMHTLRKGSTISLVTFIGITQHFREPECEKNTLSTHWARGWIYALLNGVSLIQLMTCRLVGAKRLPEPIMSIANRTMRNKFQWNWNWNLFSFPKFRFENVVHRIAPFRSGPGVAVYGFLNKMVAV